MNDKLTIKEIVVYIKPLVEKYRISEVFIFGSYARDEATENSDIDLLVYGRKL